MGEQVSEVGKMALSIKNESGTVNVNINQPCTSEKPQSDKSGFENIFKWISGISSLSKIFDLVKEIWDLPF